MSNKNDNDNLLVDQEKALDFYFDALLLPEEMSDETANENKQTEQAHDNTIKASEHIDSTVATKSVSETSGKMTIKENSLQAAKQFLKDSKLRQKARTSKTQAKHVLSSNTTVEKKHSTRLTAKEISKEIPKLEPRASVRPSDSEDKKHKIAQKSQSESQNFVAIKVNSPAFEMTTADKIKREEDAYNEPKGETQSESMSTAKSELGEEAPNLDLSLFLPKIKTLSDEEIAQQIETLTQAAVSQAKIETDLAYSADLEKLAQIEQLKSQAEELDDGPIRNIINAPSWAVPNFQVLLFQVSGLKLAVPLCELNGIVEWGDEYISELPGHKPWYLGLVQNQGRSVPVIDTLQQVVPENRWPKDYLAKRNFKHIILIDNGRWGLACETVLEVITLKTDAVKWRSSRTKRRWLLGTVIEHMCALLDSSEFSTMLKTGDDSLVS